jgi:voltage-gated potassium channel
MKIIDNRIFFLFLMVIGLLFFGTAGYMVLEGWPVFDAFYMKVITSSTVGFGEVRSLSQAGQLFTIVLILLSVSTLAYGLRTVAQYLLEQDYVHQWRHRQTMKKVNDLQNHFIICGMGKVGLSSARALWDSKRPFVVIEKDLNPDIVAEYPEMLFIDGDATDDAVLIEAGIGRASSILVTAGDDSINLFVVLSARSLNPDLYIITRSVTPGNDEKMRRAGADRVVSPYQIGGRYMENIAVRPYVTDFFEIATLDDGGEVWVEELVLHERSALLGKTVGEIDVRRRFGVTLVALRHHFPAFGDKSERVSTTIPDADSIFQAGDDLIVLGTREGLAELEAVACHPV